MDALMKRPVSAADDSEVMSRRKKGGRGWEMVGQT